MDTVFCICYNLVSHSHPGIPFLPEAYIIPIVNDTLGYVEKQATPETLKSLNIPYQETDHQQLLEICASLKPAVLEQKFRPAKKRKNFGLAEIMQEPKIKEVAANYINQKLSLFYNLVVTNQYHITHNAQRKDPFQVHKLLIGTTELAPILEFTKTDEGIEYAFSLKEEEQEKIITPQDHTIQIALNDPSWIILDNCIYQIKNLNANKLKPFFTKEKITIASKHIKTYLDKVIIPVIKNVDVIANGFQISSIQKITSFGIEILEDFISQKYVAKVFFKYDQVTFDYNSKRTTASDVHLSKNDEITITQTKRAPEAEKEIISLIESKGLIVNNNLLLELEESNDPLSIFNWVQQHYEQLDSEGFEIKIPGINDRTVNLDPHQIELGNKKKMIGLTLREQ